MNTLALCIPAYNASAYLPRLLNSAANQSIPFNEIWVYNDCSTDDTVTIAETYGATVISGKINMGCSYGKNKLAEISTCNWIHFHDADDELLPNFTTLVHKWLNTSGKEFDVLLLNYNYIDITTGEYLGSGNYNVNALQKDPLKYAIENRIVNFGVYNRDRYLKIGGFDIDKNVLYNEDNAFHQNLAKHNYKFDYLPEVTCINYRYPKSMSASNVLKCLRANYYVLEKTAATHGNKYPYELSCQLWYGITRLAACKDWEYVRKAIKLSKNLGYGYSPDGDKTFKTLTRMAPYTTVYLREKLIRVLKPHLRNEQ